MPTDILMTDVRFPSEASLKGKKTDEKIGLITNYLYMLKEQLAYNMYHIGTEQLLPSVTDEITAPLYKHLEDQDGNIAELQLTAEGLSVKVENAIGDASLALQTAESYSVRISDAEDNASLALQTAESFYTRIENAEDTASEAIQTAESFSTRISDAEGNATLALQTVEGFELRSYSSSDGTTAYIGLYNGNSIFGEAQAITLSGYVTFTDLSRSGYTTINGDNITTGTIVAIDITGCTITGSKFNSILEFDGTRSGEITFHLGEVLQNDGSLAGGLRFDDSGSNADDESQYRIFLYAQDYSSAYPVALKLQADSRMSLESGEHIWMKSSTVRILGTDVYLYGNVYINGTLIS